MSNSTTTANPVADFLQDEILAMGIEIKAYGALIASDPTDVYKVVQLQKMLGYTEYLQTVRDAFRVADEDFGADPVYAVFRKMSHVAAMLAEIGGDSPYQEGARRALRLVTGKLNDTMTDLRSEARQAVAQ